MITPTPNPDAAAGGFATLGFFFLALILFGIAQIIVWNLFPFMVWVKLNRIIKNTQVAAENLYGLYTVARQEFERSLPKSPPAKIKP
jgi:hypothetical protein